MSRWDELSDGAQQMLADFDELDLADIAASVTAGLKAVRELHRPVEHRGQTICVECSGYADDSTDHTPAPYPCPTIRAIDMPKEQKP